MTYPYGNYIVIARRKDGSYFSDTVSTDTPRNDFREIYRHGQPYEIVSVISVSDTGIERIAADRLEIETLETRHSDDADFHTKGVWNIRAALQDAYAKGYKDALLEASKKSPKGE